MSNEYRVEERNESSGHVKHVGPFDTEDAAVAYIERQAPRTRRFVSYQVCKGRGVIMIGERVWGKA